MDRPKWTTLIPPPPQLGEDSHKALARAEHKLRAAEATKVTAEKWLKRADYQVPVSISSEKRIKLNPFWQ